jgi:2-polyprenyl-3-methyl-5-hydroxy-6-metoxy-1,4-benzoquinol methylase
MSDADQEHWDSRYAADDIALIGGHGPPPIFMAHEHLFPTGGEALELACGRGRSAVWLATRGMAVRGVDVSPVAIEMARQLATESGVADHCRFDVFDLDRGLPDGAPVDLLFCHKFRDPRLDQALMERLAPGGILAMAALSEVGADPGRYRVGPGELREAFRSLDLLVDGEEEGVAWIVTRRAL